MFEGLTRRIVALARHRHAARALAAISFAESSFFPIPADVLFVPMVLARPDRAMRLAALASAASVLGGIFGWLIGHYAFDLIARPMLEMYGKMGAYEALQGRTGMVAVLVMLVTSGLAHLPPMKVVTILSGAIGFPLPLFVLSAVIARSARFFALAWLTRRYGAQVVAFLERRALAVGGGLTLLLAAGLAWHFMG